MEASTARLRSSTASGVSMPAAIEERPLVSVLEKERERERKRRERRKGERRKGERGKGEREGKERERE